MEEDGAGVFATHQQLHWLLLPQPPSPQPLRSCPRWAPAPWALLHWAPAPWALLPPARGAPGSHPGPRVMGYLGVGLLSLPLQEPELLLLLSEEVP